MPEPEAPDETAGVPSPALSSPSLPVLGQSVSAQSVPGQPVPAHPVSAFLDPDADAFILTADTIVTIPMAGGVDSLNVAAASAVALWELGRGRR